MKSYLAITSYPAIAMAGIHAADRVDLFIPGLFGFGLILPMVVMAVAIRPRRGK